MLDSPTQVSDATRECLSQGSAYSPLPLRTHAQEARGRGMEEIIAPDNHLASSNSQFEAVLNNQTPPTAIYAAANIQGSHPGTLYHSSNSAGHMSNSIPHQNPNSGSTSTSSHPIPSTKKKPAPPSPIKTPTLAQHLLLRTRSRAPR